VNLQDFIVETLATIQGATAQAAERFGGDIVGTEINSDAELNKLGFVRVRTPQGQRDFQVVEFDVAVTVSTDKSGKIALGVAALGIGADVGRDSRAEQVSRVRFKIPLALPPSQH